MTNQILENLNPTQREAVLYFDSPLLVLAGAGSGKTKVITNKIAFLVKEKGYSPKHILGVTFTNKAADEMKYRVEALTSIDARQFNISTFHSLGLRILRESGSASGFDSQWQVIDDHDQKEIIEKIIKENFSYYTSDMRETIIKKIVYAKMELNYPNNKEYLYQVGFLEDEVGIFSRYFDYQKENKLWDYEDLVSLPVKLLQVNEDLREKYAGRFKYVLVDEFQDTNPNQYELLTLIASDRKNITVVGDDDQAIYSWRGASIRFLFNFESDFPDTRVIKLEQNYRSTPQVLDFANQLIAQNTSRRPKSLWTKENPGSPVFILETQSKEDEAEKIAEIITRMKEKNTDLFPLAVLYRINSQSLAFETEFTRRNINFKIIKGLRFFDRKEIKDSIALLKLAFNPDDDISFLRVIDFLPLGIGPKTQEELTKLSEEKHISLFLALKEYMPDKFRARKIFPGIYMMHREIAEGKKKGEQGNLKVSEILSRLLKTSGYPEMLENKEEQARLLNIKELENFIKDWEANNPTESFNHLMDRITVETGAREVNDVDSPSVFLLTMHNAKGLEFPTVIVVGVNPTYMPFFMAEGEAGIEEERRLLYVAATRAIKQLVISIGSKKHSRFLSGINLSLYSIAYTVNDVLEPHVPRVQKDRLRGIMAESHKNMEEKFIEHPVFGRGKIIEVIDGSRYIVEFVKKGQKTIDTSIVPVTFL
ncbi:MAG: UvrD-helicase domain-containing protein [Candidatus Aminicenantes bacterium]|nr:MAG: UvrD-helicase domain-containing protein [Candidatus Aminicenantes bacterium]